MYYLQFIDFMIYRDIFNLDMVHRWISKNIDPCVHSRSVENDLIRKSDNLPPKEEHIRRL